MVDDNPVCIEELEYLLGNIPRIEVLSVFTDPSQVLLSLRDDQPHLVFLDIEMPGISGLELADEIRAFSSAIAIIFVTAYNEYAIQAIKKSAHDYLLKPVDHAELTETLNRYIHDLETGNSITDKLKARYSLTPRELDILELVRQGYTTDQIAQQLNISHLTVNTHRQNILHKTKCANFNALLGQF